MKESESVKEIEPQGIFIKPLDLVTSKRAIDLGLFSPESPAPDTPLFITYDTFNESVCLISEPKVFNASVCKVGRKLSAHHFHPECGGVYTFYSQDLEDFLLLVKSYGAHYDWVAIVEPDGQVLEDPKSSMLRLESAHVKQMKAFCNVHGEELKEGVVFIDQVWSTHLLIPLCNLDAIQHRLQEPQLRFRTTETGEVVFREI